MKLYHKYRQEGNILEDAIGLIMKNINIDIIIGLPNEGMKEFRHSLAETEKMQPESLTIHTLSFKRAS